MDFAAILSAAPLAEHMSEATLRQMVDLAEPLYLRGGDDLYRAGESPDYFYIAVSGRLRVTTPQDELVGHIVFGEPAGEVGAISGEVRSSNVRAVRDSVMLRLPRGDFLEFLDAHASAAVALTRRMIARMRQNRRERELAATASQSTFTIFPASHNAPVMTLAEILVRGLSGWPQARVIGSAHVDAMFGPGSAQAPYSDTAMSRRLNEWFCMLERRHRHLIFVADHEDSPWALRCLRQADRVLVLAEAQDAPARMPALDQWRDAEAPLAPVELVLLRAEGDSSPHTLDWQKCSGARAHYYLHPWDARELDAITRQITGRGIGLVLGGGGARGFAHIGLLRALEQLQIPVDVCGGTSMGAFVAAMVACGFDSVQMAQVARETFVENNYLNDYTFPRVSLIKARKFLRRLREIFGDRRIEELRRSFYSISTNLTTGATVVHDSGPLAEWVGSSMAVPGVAPPVAWQGDLLCDGGVVDNLPTDVMQNLERGAIIACSVSSASDVSLPGAGIGVPDPEAMLKRSRQMKLPRFSEILLRSATLASVTAMARAAEDRADVFMLMPVQQYGMFDWTSLDALIEIGYEEAMKQLTPLRPRLIH
ncbi:MAG TPA: patatin-like phospholipase family protein [Stenotrophobium sp.]|jgi:NTE family protein|nr:patatin-like phospholipase family protein [Stenotrophobium sp.]